MEIVPVFPASFVEGLNHSNRYVPARSLTVNGPDAGWYTTYSVPGFARQNPVLESEPCGVIATRLMRFAYVIVLPKALRMGSQYLSGDAPTSGSGVDPVGLFL